MHGQRTFLRPIEPEDIALLYAWENDSTNWQVSGTLAPYSKLVLTNYLRDSIYDIHTTKQIRFMINTLANVSIGMLDLFDYDPLHQRAGVGILIGDVAHRKQGYAIDALETLIKYAKTTLQLHQLYATIGTKNTASITLFERLNFKQMGVKKEWIKTISGFEDEAMYQLLLA